MSLEKALAIVHTERVLLTKVWTLSFPAVQFSSVTQLCTTLCDPMNCSTPGLPVHRKSGSLPKPMSTESMMPFNHFILFCHLPVLPSIFPSIWVFSNELALRIRWPKYSVSASTSALPRNTQAWSPLGWTGWTFLQSKGLWRVFPKTIVQQLQFFGAELSL